MLLKVERLVKTMRSISKHSLLLLLLMSLLLSGCQSSKEVIDIYAASSLTDVVDAWVDAYAQVDADVEIRVNYAGTNTLKLQIQQGAPADIFLSANQKYYDELSKEGFVLDGQPFAENSLCVITHESNNKITNVEDLKGEDVSLILGEENVPIGKYSQLMLQKADSHYGAGFYDACSNRVISYESNVRRIVTKIALNEADAGIVYVTDAIAAEQVKVIAIDDAYNCTSSYYMAQLVSSKDNETVKNFYDFLSSEEAMLILEDKGFVRHAKENE